MSCGHHAVLVTTVLLGLVACQDGPPVAELPIAAESDTMGAAFTRGSVVAQLQPLGDSGVSGELVLTADGQRTRVDARISGVPPGRPLLGHVHQEPCALSDHTSSAAADLGPVYLATDGTARFLIDRQLHELMSGHYSIGFHFEPRPPDVACADLVPDAPASTAP